MLFSVAQRDKGNRMEFFDFLINLMKAMKLNSHFIKFCYAIFGIIFFIVLAVLIFGGGNY